MRPLPRIVIFLGVFSLILYVGNLVVYEALAGIFAVTIFWQLALLGALLGVFSASFIAAMLIGRRYYNFFTRALYIFSAVWMGFLLYLFFASVLYGLVVMLPGAPLTSIGIGFIAGAALLSVYGVLHARNIRITEIEMTLPNVPAQWRGRRAVWISDLHLGQLHGASFARKIVAKVNALPHDIVFVGGDLYDGTGAPDIAELAAPLKALRAPLGIYFVTGNHEEFGDSSKFIAAIQSAGARVLADEMVDIDGLQLIGVDYRNASDKERFKKILSTLAIDAQKPSILLKHEPKDLDVAEAAGVSLQISGHTHRAQVWPLRFIAQLLYKGFAYGLKNFRDMQVYTSSGIGTWGPPLRVGTDSEIVVFNIV